MPFKFLTSLFKKSETNTAQDESSGTPTKNSAGQWEPSNIFESLNEKFDISINSGEELPSTIQVDFFKEIESNFSIILEKVIKETIEEVEDPTDTQEPSTTEILNCLEVISIHFENLSETPYEWEISCSSELSDFLFTFHMKGFDNDGLAIDG